MPNNVKWTGPLIINFVFLIVIRSTTPLMMHFGIEIFHSASLLVAIKCGITTLLFSLSLTWFLSRDVQINCTVINNLRNKNTYLKLVIIGLLQSAIPYILAVYSLTILPPTMLGVFMVTTPWWTILFQRLPFVNITKKISGMVKVAMVFGFIGIMFVFGPIVRQSVLCNKSAETNSTNVTSRQKLDDHEFGTCLSAIEVVTGFITMMLAPVLWGIATVYWKFYRNDVHYLVSSVGQNLVGGIFCIILWLIIGGHHNTDLPQWKHNGIGVFAVLYLGIATGWLATLLVHHLFATIGARTTNHVLTALPFIVFIEDVCFVRDVVSDKPWIIAVEIIGIILVTFGVYMTNFSPSTPFFSSTSPSRSRSNSLDDPLLQHEYSNGLSSDDIEPSDLSNHYNAPLLNDDLNSENDDAGINKDTNRKGNRNALCEDDEEEINTPVNTQIETSKYPNVVMVT